jgi:hypothetical protein
VINQSVYKQRKEPAKIGSENIWIQHSVLQNRFANRRHGVGRPDAEYQLDVSTPTDLKDALYKRLLTTASHGNRVQKANAMNRLGVFFLNASETSKSFHEAFTWFCRAAEHGLVEAKKMVFRMEWAVKNMAEHLRPNITTETEPIGWWTAF